MHIKKLEIYGFKSFPYKTVISFSKGITAIVGPNGAGKSNLLDAIKWVLGEQSSKRLRVKDLSDLIYSGNHDKKIDFAEVKLVLSHDPPILEKFKDYEEISIIRRFYRDGEGEFYINQRPCRLKDIQFLFLDLGINPQSFGIIDQGEVNKFLEISPKERKKFLEDLAGVSKIKVTEEETEKNLKETELNLVRLKDILLEVEKQYNHLKSQAEEAKRYLSLKEELKVLSKRRIKYLYIKTKKEKEIILENQNRLKLLLLDLDKKISEFEEEEKELYKKLVEYERMFKDLKNEKEEKEKDLKKLENEIAELYNVEKEIAVKLEKEKIKMNTEIKRKEELLTQKKVLNSEIENKKIKEGEIVKNLERLKSNYEDLTQKNHILKKKLQAIKKEIENFSKEILKLKERENFLKNEIDKLIKEKEKISKEKENMNKIVEKLVNEEKVLEQLINTKEEELLKIEEELENLRQMEAQRKNDLEEIKTKKMYYNTQLKNLENNLTLLNNIIKKEDIDPKWKDRTLGNFLNLDVEKLSLLEIFYGDLLKAILINSLEEIKEIGNAEGKNYIFILKENLNKLPLEITDIENLKALPSNINKFLYVFKDKLLFTPYGFILKVNVRKKGYYSLQKEINELKEQYTLIERSVKELNLKEKENLSNIQKIEEEIRNLTLKKSKFQEELKKFNLTLNQINQQKIRWEENLRGLSELIQKNKNELIQKEREFKEIEEKKDKFILQEEKLKKQREELEKEFRIAEKELIDKEKEVISLEKDLIKIKTEKEELLKRLTGIEKDLERADKFIKDFNYRKELLMNELNYLKEKLKQRKSRKEKLQSEYNYILEKYEVLEEKIAETNRNLKIILEQKKNFEKEKDNLNKQVYNQEIKLAELNLVLDNLKKEWLEWKEGLESIENDLEEIESLNYQILIKRIEEVKEELKGFQEVNLASIKEFEEVYERYQDLSQQKEDLERAIIDLREVLKVLREKAKAKLIETMAIVNEKLSEIFPFVIEGGRANLYFTEDDPLKAGIDLKIQLPHKNIKHINMLSGGEKSLCVIALLIAFYLAKPGPFCILDEVDAALDEKNSLMFIRLLKKIKTLSQVILITHNPNVMKEVDTLIGVTMEEKGVSKIIKLEVDGL
ncbi:MAG: AAA family ATPase [Caldimicrobium sp.]